MKEQNEKTKGVREPELLDAILAEMRGERGFSVPFTPERGIWLSDFRSYADRIEAAAERERDEDRQLAAIAESDEAFARCARCDRPERAPGDAAAMRKALEKCAELGDQIDNWLGSDEATVWNCRNERSAAHNIMLTARAALSEPARNCDRFATATEAASAWQAYSIVHRDRDYSPMEAFNWLFAPIKENGGNKQ